MKTSYRALWISVLFIIFGTIVLCAGLFADGYGIFRGHVVNEKDIPLQGVRIVIQAKGLPETQTEFSDKNGVFQIAGLVSGYYSAHFHASDYSSYSKEKIFIAPMQSFYIKVILTPQQGETPSWSQVPGVDYSHALHQTVLNSHQLHELPTAHNVGSLIENQDLSGTTNRIDVGGLWGSMPWLFSSRGGCSWTQNIYLLNGMDVTDPYWGGQPLFYPDFFSLHSYQHINAGHPPDMPTPGGYLNLITRQGTDKWHGGGSAFYIHNSLQSTNITPALEQEKLFENHGFDYLTEGNLFLSGPVVPGKMSFFGSITATDLSRNLAEYEELEKSSLWSGLLTFQFRLPKSTLHLLWTGQRISSPSFGAERNIPFSSTWDRKDTYHVFQAIWEKRVKSNHFIKAGISLSTAKTDASFQPESSSPFQLEIFRDIPKGTVPFAHTDKRRNLTVVLKGVSLFSQWLGARHTLQYGLEFQYVSSSSQKEIRDNLHLHFFNDNPLEVIEFNTPVEHQEAALRLSMHVQNTWTFSNFFSLYAGVNASLMRAWNPGVSENNSASNEIRWTHLSPRVGLIFPLSKSRKSALKFSFARYYHALPLNYMTYGNPNALGGWAFRWTDKNHDQIYQEEEKGELLRRTGPYFAEIDPQIKRPYTDEVSLSYTVAINQDLTFFLGGFHRSTRLLIRSLNVGVPLSAYEASYYVDIGDDRIPHTYDDLIFTVFNQDKETLGQDFFRLTSGDPTTRRTSYFGADLNLIKKFGARFSLFLSLTALQATGSANPGNTEWENDDSVIGSLFDNPNTLINAEGRLRFDRAYTGRLGISYLAPFDIRIGCVIKYYDGQPFARKIIIEGFNQGPFYIQAHPRGVVRYEYNMTTDVRLEKIFSFGASKLRFIIDGFNIFNRGLATEESEWTRPEFPLRFATEIQSPRVFRLGMTYEF